MSKLKTKISIIEDDQKTANALMNVFNETEDLVCQSIYQTAEEAISFLPQSDTNIVIADIRLSPHGKEGIECVWKIKALRPDILFIMYSASFENNLIFEALQAGASGYLIKSPSETSEELVLNAVRELIAGGAPMSPSIARKVIDSFSRKQNQQFFKELESLSEREKLILDLLSKGFLNKEIAEELKIMEGTVKQHVHKIYKKLQVNNRTEALIKYLGRP